jgi:hypothetical protein
MQQQLANIRFAGNLQAAAAGSLHRWSSAMSDGYQFPNKSRPPRPHPAISELLQTIRERDRARLSHWEKRFLDSIATLDSVSQSQLKTLKALCATALDKREREAIAEAETEGRSVINDGRPLKHDATQARQELRNKIDLVEGLVSDAPVLYFDTIVVLLRIGVSNRARAEIGKHCGSIDVRTSKACGSGYPFRMTLSQPQPEAFRLIEENIDHIVSEFHIAYDLPARTASGAEALTSVIQDLAIQPWHGSRKSRFVKGATSYAAHKRRTTRNFVVYGDRPSKVTDGPCCHIEFRFNGAGACGARGVRTCGDLLRFDPKRYINRDMKLGVIDWQSAFGILRQLADRERRNYRPRPGRLNVRLSLIKRTFERLKTPDHTPSFDDPPIVRTQRALDVLPAWTKAVVSYPLTSLLYARAK